MSIKKKICSYIKKSGLSQAQICSHLRISPLRFNKWMNGQSSVSYEILWKLCNLLSIDIKEISEFI